MRTWACAAILILFTLAMPAAVTAASMSPLTGPAASGITLPAEGATVRGLVDIQGSADHAQFQKWQLDLLPGGNPEKATFLAWGEAALPAPVSLTALDSTRFPDGAYHLRLRVVRRDGNYDEYSTGIVVANRSQLTAQVDQRSVASVRVQRARFPTHTVAGDPILYLTFDDGPLPGRTDGILELLKRHQARATFFVLGGLAERYPALIQAQVADGHALANHTHGHHTLEGVSWESFESNVLAVEEAVQRVLGEGPFLRQFLRYLRPPYAHTDENTASYAADLGYQLLSWDVDPKDWRRPGSEVIATNMLKHAYPGAVVLLHDGGGGGSQTIAALEVVLEELGRQGYQFLPLPPVALKR